MMKRDECLKVLARHVTGADIVLPVYSAAFDWVDIRPHPLNYVSHGAMGLHFVCHNGTYEANGGHPIPGRGRVDFCGFARSAGYPTVREFSDLNIFEQQIGALLAGPGPVFADLKITSSGPQERDYSRLHGPHVRQAFRAALAAASL